MPRGAQIIRVAEQGLNTCLWAIVDPAAPLETREFQVFRTGGALPLDAIYVGTWDEHPFVWHLFEIPHP